MLLYVKLVSVPDEAELPLEFLAGVVQPYAQADPLRGFALPRHVEHATPREYGLSKVARSHSLTQEAQRIEYGALARRIRSNEQVEIIQMDLLAAKTTIMIRTERRELHDQP